MQNLIIITHVNNNLHRKGHFSDVLIQLAHLNAK